LLPSFLPSVLPHSGTVAQNLNGKRCLAAIVQIFKETNIVISFLTKQPDYEWNNFQQNTMSSFEFFEINFMKRKKGQSTKKICQHLPPQLRNEWQHLLLK